MLEVETMLKVIDVLGDDLVEIMAQTDTTLTEKAESLTQKLVAGGILPYVNDDVNKMYTQIISMVLEVAFSE